MQWGSFKVLASHIWDTLNTEDLSQNPAETVKRARCSTIDGSLPTLTTNSALLWLRWNRISCIAPLLCQKLIHWIGEPRWSQKKQRPLTGLENVGSDGTTSHKHFGLLCLHTSAACGSPVWEPEGSKYVCGAAEFHECHLQPNSLTGCDGRKRHGCSLRRLHGDCSALAKPFGQISLES